ncbi:MAG: preprotein translocase subunit YajC [Bacillota bacterium]|jgi:preprotein translocase subunit YajC|nr:preprotein translocase subunit YajC [Bacillota bacterium]MDI9415712.1 preprotein translocase subunit YajC [Bacillota bacterium]NLD12302.1 preprotein translocase subunit YajC [Bacillota bacterium]HAV20384.1 preprotein translocase subunit YajC [Bacillota bacterium]HOB88364.1 preprotein translocase subunit YajC [Bacillota bacterium]
MDAQQGSMVSSLVMLALMFGIFYFFLIRPQQVQQKKRKEMLDSLRKGNTVITIGGIYGQIVDVKDDNLVLQIADNVRIRTVRGAVSSVLGKGEAAKDKDPGLAE